MSNTPSTTTSTATNVESGIKLGAEAITAIGALVASLDPATATIESLIAGIAAILPGAADVVIQAVQDAFSGKPPSPLLPQVEADVQQVDADLTAVIPSPSGS